MIVHNVSCNGAASTSIVSAAQLHIMPPSSEGLTMVSHEKTERKDFENASLYFLGIYMMKAQQQTDCQHRTF